MSLRPTDVDRLRSVVSEDTFDRRFEILGESARGAMGCVFEARDRETGERVALKLLLGVGDRARFVAEAEVLERLAHPAIVKYVRHGATSSGDPYLVMEWLAGETLAKRIARAPLDCLEAATLGERLAGALEAAHAANVVHRDLKPSNVFLVGGRVELATVIDFGVAKTSRNLTRTGQMIGTPGYMAPEQVRGERTVDRRVDLFALGCVLYEAVAARPPFAGGEVIEVLAKLLLETPAPLDVAVAGVPPRFARFVDSLLDKEPERRPGDAAVVRAELTALRAALAEGDLAALAVREPLAERAPRTVGRYVLGDLLGTGGMGVVFAAEDPELGRPVAVKLLRPDLARGAAGMRMEERLRREAKALAQLAHPNVVAVHDVGVHDGRIFVAMEYVDGETLASWLAVAPRRPREILDAFVDAGRGLAAAHASGLVHRDFKPENVLFGRDGRVRVVDFGLVRNADDARETVSPEAPTAPLGLTATGAAMGTPYYMAPEQYRGETVDATSDQFSFCVALHAALYREQPFAGDTFEELEATVCAGTIVEPPRTRGVHRRVRAAIRRGLATRPGDRFPSMTELLHELAPRSRRMWWVTGGAAAIVAATIAISVVQRATPPAPCEGAERHLAGVWDPPRSLAVASTLIATGAPYADATWREVGHTLDRYAGDWAAMHRGACEATRVRGEQTDEVLELRMACLDERRQGLDGLVATLAAPDRDIARRAITAAHALPAIADCADVAALRSPVRPPDASAKVRVAQLRGELARLRARGDAGIYEPTLAAANELLAQVRALAYRPLEAEVLALVGQLERDRDAFGASRTAYERSLLAAEAGRHDRQAATSLVSLIKVVGAGLRKFDDVPPLRDRARAVLERLGRPRELEAQLLEATGAVAIRAGQVAAGERDLQEALAMRERLGGRDDFALVWALRELAHVELTRERGDAARALLERVLAIQVRVQGELHPDTGMTRSMLGGAAFSASKYDDAIAHYLRAEAIFARAVGPDSLGVANVLSNRAQVHLARSEHDDAIRLLRGAVAIYEVRTAPDHPAMLVTRSDLATALHRSGKTAEGIALLRELLAQMRARMGPDHQDIAMTLEALADMELHAQRFAEARDHALEAKAMFERTLGPEYDPYTELRALGEAHLGLGEPAKAADALEQARRRVAVSDPAIVAELEALPGRALIEANRDRARGLALITAAWPKLAAEERRAGLAAWMKRRGIAVPR